MMVELRGLGGFEVEIGSRCYRYVADEGGTEVTLQSEQLNIDISRLSLVDVGNWVGEKMLVCEDVKR